MQVLGWLLVLFLTVVLAPLILLGAIVLTWCDEEVIRCAPSASRISRSSR